MEELYRDHLEEHCGVLCQHFIASENWEKGAEYAKMAARDAERDGSFIDAVGFSRREISCLEKLPTTADLQRRLVDARATLGLYLMQMGHFAEAEAVVEPVLELARAFNDKKRLSQLLTVKGTYQGFTGADYGKSISTLTDALQLAEESGNTVSIFFANYWLGGTLGYDCQWERGVKHFEVPLRINTELNIQWGIVAMKCSVAILYNVAGQIDRASEMTQDALRIAEESGDIYSESWAYTYHGKCAFERGYFEESEPLLLKAIAACERIRAFRQGCDAQTNIGRYHLAMGRYESSEAYFLEAVRIAEEARYYPGEIHWLRAHIALTRALRGSTEVDVRSICDWEAANTRKTLCGSMRRTIAEILVALGGDHAREAEGWLQRATEADREHGMRWELARDHEVHGDWLARMGDASRAREYLGKAVELFGECGADGWVKRAEDRLAQL
jgi:tetratricopeptide (TPR) repeat protein